MMPPHSDTPDDAVEKDPRQRLTDALLREHARLGVADDEPLLDAIRARTVERPLATRIVQLPGVQLPSRRRTSAREWMQMAAAVTATLLLVGLFLSRQRVEQPQRNEQTFQLVSRPITAVAVPTDSSGPRTKTPPPATSPSLVDLSLPPFADALPDSGDLAFVVPAPIATDPASAELLAEFSVSAEKILRLAPDRLVYEGGVILRHPEFTLQADRVELAGLHPDHHTHVGGFVAEGAEVKVEKVTTGGRVETALATSATWDLDQGGLVLAGGPPTLSSGAGFVRPVSAEGLIVLRSDGFQVIER